MRRRKWIAILPLAAACVAVLAAAQAAQATPTWFYCGKAVPAKTGKWADTACTEPAAPEGTGKFELFAGVGKGNELKFKSGQMIFIATFPPKPFGINDEVICSSMTGGGDVGVPNKVSHVALTFKGCSWLGESCSSATTVGTIKAEPLAGELGTISGGSGVGLSLTSEAKPSTGTIAEFSCRFAGSQEWTGSVIAEQTGDIETISKEPTLHFVTGAGIGEREAPGGGTYTPRVNLPVSFVEGPQEILGANFTEEGHTKASETIPAALEGTVSLKGEALMVKP